MDKGILSDREKALENNYFRQEEARLLQKLRQNANLDEIAVALRDMLHVDNSELLMRVRELGVTAETAPAFFLAPLVMVAWAREPVTKAEREMVLRLARERDVAVDSTSYAQLRQWLEVRPPDALFEASLEVLRYTFAVLPPAEREERISRVVESCQKVAETSGSQIATLLGMREDVNRAEESAVATINEKLRMGTRAAS
jgi:hypothetical protein